MKFHLALVPLAAMALLTGAGASAQTTVRTKVSTDRSMHDGVATRTTKVTTIRKHKTHRAKRILGVKVGHKTVTHKTVREVSHSSNGDHSATVKRTN